jgi:hypothetical protein
MWSPLVLQVAKATSTVPFVLRDAWMSVTFCPEPYSVPTPHRTWTLDTVSLLVTRCPALLGVGGNPAVQFLESTLKAHVNMDPATRLDVSLQSDLLKSELCGLCF